MNKKKTKEKQKRVLEQTLERLYTSKRNSPKSLFVLLLFLYVTATVIVSSSAGSSGTIMVAGHAFQVYTFAGVFSALSNICVIFLAVYYGKTGYFTALTVLLIQIPFIVMGVIVRHNLTSLPGIFGNILTIIAITVIYINNKRVEEYERKLHDQAVTDILTGLPNRFACSELVTELVRRGIPYAAVSIDINGFKSINETMGFDSGNEVLMEIAERWKRIANGGLSGTLDFITRLSGDEFALVIRNYNSEEDIVKSIKIYEEALGNQLTIYGCDFFVSASFGYALFPEDADNVDSLFSYADAAMHEVKHANNSEHIMKFTHDMLKLERTLELEGKIRTALDNDTIFFQLQPQYDMNHKLRGFEALARMKDESGTFISPGEFIPVAEKVGLIDKLDGMVFKKSADFIGELVKKTSADITLSINVSVRHLMKSDFLEEIRELIKSSGIPALQLEIEITESIMIESMDKAMNCIKDLKDIGVKIAIDDFGTGYSSLSYLNDFPADLLKIDKSFIDKMNSSDSSRQYVAAIISLGHIMGFDVISEGVEDSDQLDTLREIGCDYIQGFIWGRPLPKEDAEKVVMDSLGLK
ncbi:MAG: EAL domain-containing protein [Lachnospiraceae bacterium]|nr:EAL domain-containing protein [Lachnospiraceae bacterium]